MTNARRSRNLSGNMRKNITYSRTIQLVDYTKNAWRSSPSSQNEKAGTENLIFISNCSFLCSGTISYLCVMCSKNSRTDFVISSHSRTHNNEKQNNPIILKRQVKRSFTHTIQKCIFAYLWYLKMHRKTRFESGRFFKGPRKVVADRNRWCK